MIARGTTSHEERLRLLTITRRNVVATRDLTTDENHADYLHAIGRLDGAWNEQHGGTLTEGEFRNVLQVAVLWVDSLKEVAA